VSVSTDPFQKGLYWAFYKYMESNFIEYMKHVPFTKEHEKVHSPSLVALLLQICGYTDSAFKDMARYSEFGSENACQNIVKKGINYNIRDARKAFQPIYHLSEKKVLAKLDWCGDRMIIPFARFVHTREVSPKWWRAYQEAKHSWTSAFEKANLKNTLEALSGAFLLNVVHFPSMKLLFDLELYTPGIKQIKDFVAVDLDPTSFDRLVKEACTSHKDVKYDLRIETPLFVYFNVRPIKP
jgi:hypothetical protein